MFKINTRLASFIYNVLINRYVKDIRTEYGRRIHLWFKNKLLKNYSGKINSQIHGFPVVFNNGYTYPVTAREHPNYNNPLLELVQYTSLSKNRPLVVMDVGAAIGDTALLLISNMDDSLSKIICVDGDNEFYGYLTSNLKSFSKVVTYKHLLTNSDQIRELVRTHLGTASAQGDNMKSAITLDKLVSITNEKNIDILKIDVDGFDGCVIAGATEMIGHTLCDIIFEWHPKLYSDTGNDYLLPFEVLKNLGYNDLLWFDKFGCFSHFESTTNTASIEKYATLCLNQFHGYDWHYDVIAIHSSKQYDLVRIAELRNAKHKKSAY